LLRWLSGSTVKAFNATKLVVYNRKQPITIA
jgi:hypothetical protein